MTNPDEKSCDVIFLDTETTGLDPEADEILQISVMNNSGEILLNSYISIILIGLLLCNFLTNDKLN
mgnify:FL=1